VPLGTAAQLASKMPLLIIAMQSFFCDMQAVLRSPLKTTSETMHVSMDFQAARSMTERLAAIQVMLSISQRPKHSKLHACQPLVHPEPPHMLQSRTMITANVRSSCSLDTKLAAIQSSALHSTLSKSVDSCTLHGSVASATLIVGQTQCVVLAYSSSKPLTVVMTVKSALPSCCFVHALVVSEPWLPHMLTCEFEHAVC